MAAITITIDEDDARETVLALQDRYSACIAGTRDSNPVIRNISLNQIDRIQAALNILGKALGGRY